MTFTNSFGGQKNNFPLRGEWNAFWLTKNCMNPYTNLYLNLTGEVKLEAEYLQWFHKVTTLRFTSQNITRHERKIFDRRDNTCYIKETDIFLIPAEIHSMSVVKSLCYGNIVLGSNGWGFNEFLDEQFQCSGQRKIFLPH